MKLLAVLCPTLGFFTLIPALSAQQIAPLPSRVPAPKTTQTVVKDRVTIQSKTVKITRGQPGQEYPNYRNATIRYPQVTGLANPTVLRKVQNAVSLKTVFGQSLEEIRKEFQTESWWLTDIEYKVNYNRNFLLDITFTRSGIGAYPSSYDEQVVVDLRTGKTLKASDLFKPESVNKLVAEGNRALRSQIQQKVADFSKTAPPEDVQLMQERLEKSTFKPENLDRFSVSEKGITFLYDYDLPHVIKAWEPSGRLFFTYEQLKPYLQPEGVLSVVLRS